MHLGPSAAEDEAATAYGRATHTAHDRSVRQRSEEARRSADSYAAGGRARCACVRTFQTQSFALPPTQESAAY